jgi:two-component system sensor histidine kinase EvgS
MQGMELAKELRDAGHQDLIIIGVTADIYAIDACHQFLAAGMNGVLIKPLSLQTLENELQRHFIASDIETEQIKIPSDELLIEPARTLAKATELETTEYSFDIFSNLLKTDPKQIQQILTEILKVHYEVLQELTDSDHQHLRDEKQFKALLHKVKGGAQLINAQSFLKACQELERDGDVAEKIKLLIDLLQQENRKIGRYRQQFRSEADI